jgi:non-reducing end alpha-L-arabinofuranosidase
MQLKSLSLFGSIAVSPGTGYRNDSPKGTAVHGQPEGVYMVTSALNLNEKCCFDFGNAETNNLDNKAGHMDAINFMCHGNPCSPDAGLDMEDGIYGHLKVTPGTTFVTDMGASNDQHTYAICRCNAQSGIGGDNNNWAKGYFLEGVMTRGTPSAKAMEAVQSNIVAAGFPSRTCVSLPQE